MRDMDCDRIYSLRCAWLTDALHVQYAGYDRFDERGLCLGRWRPGRALPFKHQMGDRPYDLVTTSMAVITLISDRTADVLRPFSGWSTFPVKILDQDGVRIPGYHGLVISGRCGPINKQRGEMLWRDHKPPPGQIEGVRFYLWFDPATWDGSDVFSPEGTAYQFVTQRVKDAVEQAGLTNFDFTPLPLA